MNDIKWQAFTDLGCFYFTGGPSYLLDPIALKLGAAEYNDDYQDYIVPCDDKTLGNMEFTFGKFKVVMKPGDYLDKNNVSNLQIICCVRKLFICLISTVLGQMRIRNATKWPTESTFVGRSIPQESDPHPWPGTWSSWPCQIKHWQTCWSTNRLIEQWTQWNDVSDFFFYRCMG